MRHYHTYNGNIVLVGAVLPIGTVTKLHDDHIIVRYADGRMAEKRATNRSVLKRHSLPRFALYDAETGVRLSVGSRCAGGEIVGIYEDAARIRVPAGTLRFVEFFPSSHWWDMGLDPRTYPHPSELNKLPRGEGNTVTLHDGTVVPALDAVYVDGVYRARSEYIPYLGMTMRLVRRDDPTYEADSDGRYAALPGDFVMLTHGPSTGARVPVADSVVTDDGFAVRIQDAVTVLTRSGVRQYAAAPSNTVTLPDGRLATLDALTVCRGSGELVLRCETVEIEGRLYSSQWFNAHGASCSECGRYFLFGPEGRRCDCPACRTSARSRIRSYSCHAAGDMAPEKDVPIKFGIELEVGCDRGYRTSDCATVMADAIETGVDDITQYAVFKSDGSINCVNGFEIVTRPDAPEVHKRVFASALSVDKVRKYMSSYTNNKCGIHIHVSRAPLSALWVGRMLVLVNSPAMSQLVCAVAGRPSCQYSRIRDKKLSDGNKIGEDRYEALNVSGGATIEFRIFRGTLSRDSFLKNIEFVEAVLEYCRPAGRSLTAIADPDAFIVFIAKSRKSYPSLHSFLIGKGLVDGD